MNKKLPLPLLSSIAALPPLAVDMYLPAIPVIADDLNSQISVIQNSLSIYLLGFGLGLLFFGPCSDRFGRRPLALFGLTGFAISSYLVSISSNAEFFLGFRFLQGLLGSAATVVVPAMIRDCLGKDTAKGLSTVSMIMLLAPLIAPLLGSYLLTLGQWPILFQVLTGYAVLVFAISLFYLPETKPENEDIKPRSIFSNYKIILSKHSIYRDLLLFMLSSLAFFAYLTSASFIYITHFGLSEMKFSVLFASTAASLILANIINIRFISSHGPRKLMKIASLSASLFATMLVVVTLANLGVYWTLTCFVFIIASLGIATINANALVLMEFPNQASSASAVTGTLRFGTGALAGPILAFIYTGTPLPIALMIFITLSVSTLVQFRGKR